MRLSIAIASLTLLLSAGAVSAQQIASESDTAYREQADVQLNLSFQGLAEGGLSRGLRFFGGTGRCQAWYTISKVIAAPSESELRDGDRLKLEYDCGRNREFESEAGYVYDWADASGAYAHVWLYSGDIKRQASRTWEVENPGNLLPPVAVQSSR